MLKHLGLVIFLFIVLKLTGAIDWSWIWVLFPLWGTIIFFILVFIIVYVFDTFRKIPGLKQQFFVLIFVSLLLFLVVFYTLSS
jgi:hypothetical protein